jgi:hypothetical protein
VQRRIQPGKIENRKQRQRDEKVWSWFFLLV